MVRCGIRFIYSLSCDLLSRAGWSRCSLFLGCSRLSYSWPAGVITSAANIVTLLLIMAPCMLHYHAAKQCKSLLLLLSFSRVASLLTWPGPHLESRILANHVQYQFDAMQNFKVSSVSLILCQAI